MSIELAKNEALVLFNQSVDNKNFGGMKFIAATSAALFGDDDETTIGMKKQVSNYLPF